MPVLSWTLIASRDGFKNGRPVTSVRPSEPAGLHGRPPRTRLIRQTSLRPREREGVSSEKWSALFNGNLHRFATGPTGSPLRANPSPEVTDRICRLPLSTFVHRLETPQLGDLMRISVRPERVIVIVYVYKTNNFFRPRFQGPATTHETSHQS